MTQLMSPHRRVAGVVAPSRSRSSSSTRVRGLPSVYATALAFIASIFENIRRQRLTFAPRLIAGARARNRVAFAGHFRRAIPACRLNNRRARSD